MTDFSDCGSVGDPLAGTSAQDFTKAPFDTVRALVIFATFPNAYEVDQCGADGIGWPDRLAVPSWANDLIEDTDEPSNPGSITHFYYEMSDGDNDPTPGTPRHIIQGTVHPTVVEAPLRIKDYRAMCACPENDRGAAVLANEDIVAAVVPALGNAALDYDLDGDEFIDFLFIYYRERRDADGTRLWTGGSGFTDHWVPSDMAFTTPNGGTIRVGPNTGASIFSWVPALQPNSPRVFDKWIVGSIMAHEYGHHLGLGLSHLPEAGPFALMGGNGEDCPKGVGRTAAILSGYHRARLGWIDPIEIDSTVTNADTTVVLESAATNGDRGYAIVHTQSEDQYFLLECRVAHSSPYLIGQPSPTCPLKEGPSGLLIAHITGNTTAQGANPCNWVGGLPPWLGPGLAFELATGCFDETTWELDPVNGRTELASSSDGIEVTDADLFQPGLASGSFANVFAPYTNPNTNLYADTTYHQPGGDVTKVLQRQDVYSGISFYNIEWANAGHDSIRVSIRFDGSDPTADADTIRVATKWEGRIQLSRDLAVAPGVELEIAEGSQVIAKASDSTKKLQIKTRGTTSVNGTPANPVEFLSSRDSAFTHYLGSGESGAGVAPGDWGGLGFHLEGSYEPSYGRYGTLQLQSVVKDATIKDAEVGIRVTHLIAPGIEGVSFTENELADILLDGNDVVIPAFLYSPDGNPSTPDYIPQLTRWDLEAPVNVVATHSISPIGDAWFGTTGLLDLIAQGVLGTRTDQGGTGATVNFFPDTITPPESPAAGNDWGGIYLDFYAAGSVLEAADVGYASNPVYVLYPDDVTIRDTTIHHFASTGLWVYGSTGNGLLVEGTTIDRGEGLNAGLGSRGVFLDRATNVQFGSPGAPNSIVLDGANSIATGGAGIFASLGKILCYASGPTETIRIANTAIVGPGINPNPNGNWSGVRFQWMCGTSTRAVEIESNWIGKFNFAGLDLLQAVDVQVTCNQVEESRRGLSFSRDAAATGLPVRLRDNTFQQVDEDDDAAVATDASLKLKLGPINAAADKGRNVIKVWDTLVDFIENDEAGTDLLDATNNYWYLVGSSGETFLSAPPPPGEDENDEIDKRCRTSTGGDYSADATTDVSDHKSTETGIAPCSDRPSAPSGTRVAGPIAASPASPPGELVRLDGDVPRETRLGRPFPNPTSGGITIPFALSRDRQGETRVEIFDVTGRRVRTVAEGPLGAAWYEVSWPGVDGSGERVSPGIYFVRFRAGEYTQTTKVTVLR